MAIGIALAVLGAGVGLNAIGASQNQAAQDDAQRTRNAALAKFAGVQNTEFNSRQADLTASTDRIGTLKDQAAASLNNLRAGNAAENAGITTKYSGAAKDAALQTSTIKNAIDQAKNAGEDASDVRLNDVTTAERGRQSAFQASGTALADKMLAGQGVAPFTGARDSSAATRQALINGATAGDGTVGMGATTGVDPNSTYGKALASSSAGAVGSALRMAGGNAKTAAYGDAGGALGRQAQDSASRVDILGRKATASREALDPEMTAAKMVRDNADADATERKNNADADMGDFTKLLQQDQTGEEARVKTRQDSYDQLIQDVANGSIQTEEDFINALNANSLNYEDAIRQLTNYQIGGTIGSSFIGQLLTGAGSSLSSAGAAHLFA